MKVGDLVEHKLYCSGVGIVLEIYLMPDAKPNSLIAIVSWIEDNTIQHFLADRLEVINDK